MKDNEVNDKLSLMHIKTYSLVIHFLYSYVLENINAKHKQIQQTFALCIVSNECQNNLRYVEVDIKYTFCLHNMHWGECFQELRQT